eukprot:scaffold50852_cov66-Phaeocystis_antarctica.AAC.1
MRIAKVGVDGCASKLVREWRYLNHLLACARVSPVRFKISTGLHTIAPQNPVECSVVVARAPVRIAWLQRRVVEQVDRPTGVPDKHLPRVDGPVFIAREDQVRTLWNSAILYALWPMPRVNAEIYKHRIAVGEEHPTVFLQELHDPE